MLQAFMLHVMIHQRMRFSYMLITTSSHCALHCAVATVFMMQQQHGLVSQHLDDLLLQWLRSFNKPSVSTAAAIATKQHSKAVHGTSATVSEHDHRLLTCALVTAYFQLHTALQFTMKVRAKQHLNMMVTHSEY
jgi:hypothetical protein